MSFSNNNNRVVGIKENILFIISLKYFIVIFY